MYKPGARPYHLALLAGVRLDDLLRRVSSVARRPRAGIAEAVALTTANAMEGERLELNHHCKLAFIRKTVNERVELCRRSSTYT